MVAQNNNEMTRFHEELLSIHSIKLFIEPCNISASMFSVQWNNEQTQFLSLAIIYSYRRNIH